MMVSDRLSCCTRIAVGSTPIIATSAKPIIAMHKAISTIVKADWLEALWSRSAGHRGFCAPSSPNPKSEIRNPKQIRMTEKRKFETRDRRPGSLVCTISSLNLLIVSDFEIRISDLAMGARTRLPALSRRPAEPKSAGKPDALQTLREVWLGWFLIDIVGFA